MSLKFATSGRPMIECINPDCKKLHAIYRRGDYVNRAQTKVVCRSCGTKWALNEQDKTILQQHYEQRQKEIDEKKREKELKNQEKQAKTETGMKQNKPDPQPKPIKKPIKQQEKPKKQKSWLEQLGL